MNFSIQLLFALFAFATAKASNENVFGVSTEEKAESCNISAETRMHIKEMSNDIKTLKDLVQSQSNFAAETNCNKKLEDPVIIFEEPQRPPTYVPDSSEIEDARNGITRISKDATQHNCNSRSSTADPVIELACGIIRELLRVGKIRFLFDELGNPAYLIAKKRCNDSDYVVVKPTRLPGMGNSQFTKYSAKSGPYEWIYTIPGNGNPDSKQYISVKYTRTMNDGTTMHLTSEFTAKPENENCHSANVILIRAKFVLARIGFDIESLFNPLNEDILGFEFE